jgi:hypothetical protein
MATLARQAGEWAADITSRVQMGQAEGADLSKLEPSIRDARRCVDLLINRLAVSHLSTACSARSRTSI